MIIAAEIKSPTPKYAGTLQKKNVNYANVEQLIKKIEKKYSITRTL